MRDLRQISGMTQAEVADRVGLTRQAISSYESGRTQPDLDMLVKLADLYQVEATDILYGRGGEQKKLRTVRKMAAIVFGAVSILVFVAAGMLLLMNSFFAVPRGADMANTRQLVEARFAILSVFDALKGIIQGLSWVGCLVLAVEIRRLKRLPSIQKCLVAALAFATANIGCVSLLAVFDPVYSYADYLFIAAGALPPAALLLLYRAMLGLGRKRTVKAREE